MTTVMLRKATMKDSEIILQWRNDNRVRQSCFHQEIISIDSHMAWLDATLSAINKVLLIAEKDGISIGVLRFDLYQETAEINIYIDPERQGQGLGKSALLAGSEWVSQHFPQITKISGKVLSNNIASQKIFSVNGFKVAYIQFEKSLLTHEIA